MSTLRPRDNWQVSASHSGGVGSAPFVFLVSNHYYFCLENGKYVFLWGSASLNDSKLRHNQFLTLDDGL